MSSWRRNCKGVNWSVVCEFENEVGHEDVEKDSSEVGRAALRCFSRTSSDTSTDHFAYFDQQLIGVSFFNEYGFVEAGGYRLAIRSDLTQG